jgi:hypothetical protein
MMTMAMAVFVDMYQGISVGNPLHKILWRDRFLLPRQRDVDQKCHHLAVGATCRRHVTDIPSQDPQLASLVRL